MVKVMRIAVINIGLCFLCFLSNSYATSDEWSTRWKPSANNVNLNGSDNTVDISSDAVNEADVTSTTNQNNQACPNLSTQPGASLC